MKREVCQLQTNCAIAVLSAEAAHRKVGSVAPFFRMDRETYLRAWMDAEHLPLAVFPDNVLTPIRATLERARNSPETAQMRAVVFRE